MYVLYFFLSEVQGNIVDRHSSIIAKQLVSGAACYETLLSCTCTCSGTILIFNTALESMYIAEIFVAYHCL